MELPNELDIVTMDGGALIERLNFAMSEVLKDCADVNKVPDSVREIVCKIKVKPDESRIVIAIGADVNTKLGTRFPILTKAWMDNEEGRAVELNEKQRELPLTFKDDSPQQEPSTITVFNGTK